MNAPPCTHLREFIEHYSESPVALLFKDEDAGKDAVACAICEIVLTHSDVQESMFDLLATKIEAAALAPRPHTYTLREIKDGTGFPSDARFVQVPCWKARS